MPDGRQVKRVRAALGGPSLAHPSELVPPAPPNAGLRLGCLRREAEKAAAAELTKVVKEVKAALVVYMHKASSSKRYSIRSHLMF